MEGSGISKTIKSARSKSISGGNVGGVEGILSTSLGKTPTDIAVEPAGKKPQLPTGRRKSSAGSNTNNSMNAPPPQPISVKNKEGKERPRKPAHQTNNSLLFGHLPEYERQTTESLMRRIKDTDTIHPPVMAVAIAMAEGRITGSTERCVAMLECFKSVILQSYSASPDQAISRHLEAFLRPQISYLVSARPLSVSMSHAIRHLKLVISQLPPEIGEDEAKQAIIKAIDSFLRNRIELAGKLIVESALSKMDDDEQQVILTYGKSSLVSSLLHAAHHQQRRFRVIMVLSSSGGEDGGGLQQARELAKGGIECTLVSLSSLGFVLREATKVIIGAQAIFSNGALLGKAGIAVIGLLAHQHNVPVMVLAETLKFTERVQLDAFVYNELADPRHMIEAAHQAHLRATGQPVKVRACSMVYDVMPAEYITMIVSEVGMIPVTSVPVVLREHPY